MFVKPCGPVPKPGARSKRPGGGDRGPTHGPFSIVGAMYDDAAAALREVGGALT